MGILYYLFFGFLIMFVFGLALTVVETIINAIKDLLGKN